MADMRIHGLPVNPVLDGADEFAVYDASTTSDDRVTLTNIASKVANVNSNANDDTATLTNKSIDSDNNTITNIVNADIKSTAGIDATKLGDGTVTNTELSYISEVTSDVQTQLNSLISVLNNMGTPPRVVTFEARTDGSKQFTITEAEIQTAVGLSNSLLYSVNYDNLIIQTREITSSTVNEVEIPTLLRETGQTDNSVRHLSTLGFTMANASADYLVSIMFTTIDAS